MRLGYLWFHFNHSDSYSHGLVLGTIFNVPLNSLNDNKMPGVSSHKTSMQHNTDIIIDGRRMADYCTLHSASIWAMYFR